MRLVYVELLGCFGMFLAASKTTLSFELCVRIFCEGVYPTVACNACKQASGIVLVKGG